MENDKKNWPTEDGRVSLQRLYALLCALKASVDRLAVQIRQLRKEQGEGGNE